MFNQPFLSFLIIVFIAAVLLFFLIYLKYLKIRKDIKRLDQQKSEFISVASHQLRGPMSVIHGYVSMILEGDYGQVPEKLKEPLNRSLRSSKALGFLIDDYLDTSQIERGEMEYIITKVNLTELLNNVVDEFRLIAEKSGLKFKYKRDKRKKDIYVKADKNKLNQIISNIIDNAIKYTPKGSVEINIEQKEDRAVVSIIDTGIGIEPTKSNEIFNKFARADEAISMNVSGTGLGLFIAKVMIEAQDGNIWVESEGIGKGSTFSISIPIAKEQ